MNETKIGRCHWAAGDDAIMRAYHDTEWGIPEHSDKKLFEMLTLEGAQAGLSWRTVLMRREAYREAYHGFDIERVAAMADAELEQLLTGSRLIRNRLKIYSVRENARAALAVGDLNIYLWSLAHGAPLINRWDTPSQVPATTEASERMSKALRKKGFRFVGSTICYAFMQATGMVDDHLTTCLCYKESQNA
jgi:DNA-3-methyladenine glycosylase I